MTYPDHCWYAVATSGQVSAKPFAIRFLDEEIVLKRSAQATPQAFAGRCAHRGCSLGRGWTVDDRLVCPYHGWQYNDTGECVHIPALREDEAIPAQARIRTYSVQDLYGFVWIWYSSSGRNPEPIEASIPELKGQQVHHGGDIAFFYKTDYTRTLENGIDPTHAAFVHGGSIGKVDPRSDFSLDPYELIHDHHSIYARMPIKVKKINGLMRYLLKADTNPYKEYRFLYPNVVVSTIHFGRFTLSALQAHVPETEGETTVRVTNSRNFLHSTPILSRWFDGVARSTGVQISLEDNAVIAKQMPGKVAFKGSGEVLVRSDEILIAFRRMMRERINVDQPKHSLL